MSEPSSPPQQTTTAPTVAPVLSTHEDPSFFTLPPPPPPPAYAPKTHAELRSFFEIDRTITERNPGVLNAPAEGPSEGEDTERTTQRVEKKLYILADTSYSSCCADEIAAEHVSADVLVHYGRACLSPTARLPVIYVFTHPPLSQQSVLDTFTTLYPDRTEKVVVMADVTYTSHLHPIVKKLREESGYTQIWEAEVIHDPSALLPNRTLPSECVSGASHSAEEKAEMARILREEWTLFHISTPMTSLLLVLASRVGKVHIFPTDRDPTVSAISTAPLATMPLLRRRYALLTQLRAASIIGILVSTLSVNNYLPLISLLQRLIRSKGKKSYMVVVGKVNQEKLANFSEVEGWVGVGCWEQGVVGGALERGDGGRGFWRGVVTPWECGVALEGMGDREGEGVEAGRGRLWEWNGEWITDFDTLLKRDPTGGETAHESTQKQNPEEEGNYDSTPGTSPADDEDPSNPLSHIPESLPPDFDLRTGRYSSTSRPLAHLPIASTTTTTTATNPASSALTEKNKHTHLLAPTGGVLSPAAEFLKEKRTWRGLVVGYEDEDWTGESGVGGEGAQMEVGRSGVARGYNLGWEGERR
ncbi:putative diphthamide synthesis protein-domain-containing protein [Terfezia claveryi]|nr:putative diphthamide synthesis protein-domain-containing protein [Terfezia claveryi]